MPRDEEAFLLDMVLAAKDAVSFAEDLTLSEFLQNTEKQRAIVHAVQEFGEASTHIGSAFKVANPSIAWRDMVGLRNRIIHAYFDIELDIVWDTVRNDLPLLIQQLRPHIPQDGD